jgi:hypothetical protein
MNFYSNYRFTLDIQKSKSQVSIPVHYGDTGNRFYITFTDGGNPYIIPEGCRADIYIKKPDPHKSLVNACIIENNALIRYEFNKNTASVEGMHNCELRLYSADGRIITSPSFVMVVDERVVYDDEIGSPEDFDRLIALDVIANEENRIESEYLRSENEKDRQAAETARVYAENARDVAEAMRKETEAARVDAENARVSAENARVSAENDRGQELAVLKPYVETHIPNHETRISNHETRISANENSISNHEERISGIEQYLGGDNFIVDDSIAYQKSVPKNACEKAKILSVGGMTYKTENLIPFPYFQTNYTIHGVTFTVNDDGTITVNGTSTGTAYFVLWRGVLPIGKYFLSGAPKDGSTKTLLYVSNNDYSLYKPDTGSGVAFEITIEEEIHISTIIQEGETASNLLFKPMLNYGTTALPYRPFFTGLRNAKVTELKSEGANLIPYPYKHTTKVENGITFIDNGDGSISIKGTATGNAVFYLYDDFGHGCNFITAGEYYSRSEKGIETSATAHFMVNCYRSRDAHGESFEWFGGATTAQAPNDFIGAIIYIVVLSGTTIDTTVTPMLNHGSVSLPYKPYVGTLDTFAIPEEAQVSNGINDECYDYLDFARKKVIKNVGVVDFGALNFSVYANDANRTIFVTSITGILPNTDSNKIAALLVDGYRSVSQSEIWKAGDITQSAYPSNASSVYVIETPNMSMDEFKSKINGKKLYYCLAAPEVIDVSSANLPDPYIEVEAGGTITAVNEHNFAAPSSIKYLVTYPKEV